MSVEVRIPADITQDSSTALVAVGAHPSTGSWVKRAFDFLASMSLFVVLMPLLLLIAILVRLTSTGPVLVRQERLGLYGRPFTVYKFRSMVVDAEAKTGPVFATADDSRRTAVGRILRRLSLDELPQLYNILRGEMSFVGPRPERPFFVRRFDAEIPRYLERLHVRPGVTGWAQVNGLRGNTSMSQRTRFDLYYIEHWSLWLDVKILFVTAVTVLFHRHAY